MILLFIIVYVYVGLSVSTLLSKTKWFDITKNNTMIGENMFLSTVGWPIVLLVVPVLVHFEGIKKNRENQ